MGDRNAVLKRPKPELFFTCHHNSESYGASGGTKFVLEVPVRPAVARAIVDFVTVLTGILKARALQLTLCEWRG